MSYDVTVIGVVESTLTDRADAPRQGDEGRHQAGPLKVWFRA
jgi:hypothetical protein